MSQIHRASGQCGRRAYVTEHNEPGEQGFIVKFSGVNGILKMWDDQVVTIESDDSKGTMRERVTEAKTEAIEAANDWAAATPSNIERMAYLMNYSKAGPLIQLFVIQAVDTFSDAVIKAGPAASDSAVISGAAWVRCAEDAKEKLAL